MKTTTYLPIGICGAAIFLISQFGVAPQWVPWFSHETLEIMGHFGLYGCLGFVVARYLSVSLGLGAMVLVLFTADVCGLYGMTDEFHQSLVPGRSAQFLDVMADFTGGLCGALAHVSWQYLTGDFGTLRSRPELGAALAVRRAVPVLTAFVLVATPMAFHWDRLAEFLHSHTEMTSMVRDSTNPPAYVLNGFDSLSRTGRLQQASVIAPDATVPLEKNPDLLDFVRVVSSLAPNQ